MTAYRQLRVLAKRLLLGPAARRLLEDKPLFGRIYRGWQRTHPYDRAYGVDTTGYFMPAEVGAGHDMERHSTGFASSQPSVIRRALQALGDVADLTFVDVGCGKGRAMLIASEFPFRAILGIELSPKLAAIAARNAAIVAAKFPSRPKMTVVVGDAMTTPIPPGPAVLYLFHPFNRAIVAKLADRLVSLIAGGQEIYVVFCNPVFGDVLDGHAELTRYFAGVLDYEDDEIGYAPSRRDVVIVWGPKGATRITPSGDIGKCIVETTPGWDVTLA